jgi:hypothetical protein
LFCEVALTRGRGTRLPRDLIEAGLNEAAAVLKVSAAVVFRAKIHTTTRIFLRQIPEHHFVALNP